MSFIGNFAAADAAKKIGKYNNDLFQLQSDYQKAKADIRLQTYNQVTRPLLIKKYKKNYAAFKVDALRTGAELREGESTYLAALEFRVNQATDLVLNDYNAEMDNMEQVNQSILLAAKGTGEAFKGDLTARTETIKGFASLLSTANSFGVV
jgi:hypothetical protein